ncbi:molybdopterin-dependent oxidoreductase [Leptospira perdikensis]|uniref:Oxidoreductase molybdopterin-binding domain-containing protein n=1 Tax=Leptospira perdikensis TaxID=2484948 RepID=A0A4R9J541_9LEPT|nr:molybdopterin-dependent oxidoreductase [Leptospira perdikensis]TGL33496.1 hypothetical protein EHQ49_17865 [Leptospira perdikensis]
MFYSPRRFSAFVHKSIIFLIFGIQFTFCSPKVTGDGSDLVAFALLSSENTFYSHSFSLKGPENNGNTNQTIAPYFESGLYTITSLQNESKFPQRVTLYNFSIKDKNGNLIEVVSSFTGVLLRDLINIGGKFKPFDKGKDGRATVVILEGKDGFKAVVSYTELMRTTLGAEMLIAFEKNGALLDANSGSMAFVSKGDKNQGSRYVKYLSKITVTNEWLNQSGTGTTSSFSITGDIVTPLNYSLSDLQNVSSFQSIDFTGIGPISNSKHYISGKGVSLLEILSKVTLRNPNDLQSYYVILEATDKYRFTHSYSELSNTIVGSGSGTSATPGVIVITEFKKGLGGDYPNPPASPSNYTSCSGTNNTCDTEYIATISSEDTAPYGGDVSSGINLGPRKMSWLNTIIVKKAE